MASIPSIPPLFCSTPPPIDFNDEDDYPALPAASTLDEEDDDAFGDFEVASQSHEDTSNADVPSLPRTPVHLELHSSTNSCEFDDAPRIFGDQKVAVKNSFPHSQDARFGSNACLGAKPVEAFNLAILESNTPPPLDLDEIIPVDINNSSNCVEYHYVSNDCDLGAVDNVMKSFELETKDEDNLSLTSLKLDTLSLSSEKQSGCSSISEDVKVGQSTKQIEGNATKDLSQLKKTLTLTPAYENENSSADPCIVKIEDIIDDSSDDECYSPKKMKNIDEANASPEDFFAIHSVTECDNASSAKIRKSSESDVPCLLDSDEKVKNVEQESVEEKNLDDFAEFADFKSMATHENFGLDIKEASMPQDEFANFVQTSTLNENLVAGVEENIDKALHNVAQVTNVDHDSNAIDDEDEFDDFQDFSTAPIKGVEGIKTENNVILESATNLSKINVTEKSESEFDDEFGDFEEAQFALQTSEAEDITNKATSTTATVDIIQSADCISNLSDRFKFVLEMMFPRMANETHDNKNNVERGSENIKKHLEIDSIDSAKALNYQWIHSEVRHSLIKSLGIDSRNILYGEKWNSPMPRFAANLSFNPLEPMKPQQINHSITTSESSHSNSLNEKISNSVKTDVPAVEFDWNSSGLVNPLDGSKEITHTRETETIHQTQSGQSDATVEQWQQQQQTHTTSKDDSDINKNAIQTATDSINSTTAASAVLNTTTTAALSSIISTVSISNDNDDGDSTGSDNFNLNEIQCRIAAENNNIKEEKETDNHNTDEVVTTSTFAGPLKETHIYTPSKSDTAESKTSAITKTTSIDFDYKIAAAGIIIDETVVKKEYHDIVYNPGFNSECSISGRAHQETFGGVSKRAITNNFLENSDFEVKKVVADSNDDGENKSKQIPKAFESENKVSSEYDDEFSDFQSVPPLAQSQVNEQPTAILPKTTKDIANNSSCSTSRTNTPTFGGGNEMILSPAILLPQAISMESNNKPKIVWGDATVNINPDELARIEELFPQPKTIPAKVPTETVLHNNTPQRNTPTRNIVINGYQQQQKPTQQPQLSISASIAQKELNEDDDDWTEFVSVPVDTKLQNFTNSQNNNNNQHNIMQRHAPTNRSFNMSPNKRLQQQMQQQWQQSGKMMTSFKRNTNEMPTTNHTNDEEWSDFVSSTPAAAAAAKSAPLTATSAHLRAPSMLPQFNSGAWQNANFYNNPLSFYQSQQQQTTIVPKMLQNNNSSANNYNNNYQLNYIQQQQQQQPRQQQQLQLQQQIHIMQDFSTAPPHNRTFNASGSSTSAVMSGTMPSAINNVQFQMGSAKVAPSISLIPDLGFVAPATPTHTAYINSLPKPSFSTNIKK